MIKGIDVDQRIEVSLSSDQEEVKTIFVIKPLSGLEIMEFSNGTKEDIFNMIVKSIVEVKNFNPQGITTQEVIQRLEISDLGELINKINSINHITRQDQKN